MNTKEVSNLALAPIVRMFTYAVIKSMRIKNLSHTKFTVHSDMVPKFSNRIIQASLGERFSVPDEFKVPEKFEETNSQIMPMENPAQSFSKENIFPSQSFNQPMNSAVSEVKEKKLAQKNSNFVSPISNVKNDSINFPSPSLSINKSVPMNNMPPPQQMEIPPQQMNSSDKTDEELTQFYGKITPLLNDPSVSVVECSGMGRPVMIIRMGQKQPTKIILSEKDIEQILNKISETAHIPIMEGVFRAAVDNFSVNAVISEMIGSRFVIRKQQLRPQQLPPFR